ncbi:MAG: hypothetical protein ACE5I7_09490 [Candidatus Binatia bacterium]
MTLPTALGSGLAVVAVLLLLVLINQRHAVAHDSREHPQLLAASRDVPHKRR